MVKRLLGTLLALSVITTFHAVSAFGAEEFVIEEMVVTGSRIQREDLTANSPVTVVGQQELEFTNTVNLERLLRQLPQTAPGATEGVNNGNEGAATLDLRGLGDERTLVLVNGKRFVPFDSQGQVDINNIPAPLIERVDVVTGGASAVYGSDAMAGVVNFVLRDDFEGVEIGTSYSETEESDGEVLDTYVLIGGNFDDGRGNATVHFSYTDREAVFQGDRDFSEVSIDSSDGSESGSSTDTNSNIIGGADWTLPGVLDEDTFAGFDTDGNPVPRGTRRFNFNPFNLLQVPQTRYQTTALVHYDIADNIEAFGRVHFANNEISTEIAPSGTFFLGFEMPLDNPFLTPTTQALLTDPDNDGTPGCIDPVTGVDPCLTADGSAANILIGRRTIEVGPRLSNYETTAYQVIGGLRGSFENGWLWEVSGQYGKSKLTTVFENDLSSVRVQQSLNAITDPDTGQIICDPALNPDPGCAPSNFFGDGNLSQEAANFIALQLNEDKDTDQLLWTAQLTGDLFGYSMPWTERPIGFAIGAEYREETSTSNPDQCYQTPDCSIGFGSTVAVDNEYDVSEVFGEILVPVLDTLNFEAGYRYADYSTVDDVSAWKVGGDWEIFEGFRLRTMYQEAVRAPNIFEFGAPQRPNVGDANFDPCSGEDDAIEGGFDIANDPALQAICVATGSPASGAPGLISGQINITDGGNPDLKEEESETWTVGFVWQPWFADGLSLTIDYYDISIDDAIDSFVENDVLSGCYDASLNPGLDPNNSFCQLITRDGLTGALFGASQNGLLVVSENIAKLETSGVDFAADYAFDLPGDWGSLQLGLMGNYLDEYTEQASSVSPENSCEGLYGNTCQLVRPEWQFQQRTVWTIRDFTFSYRWRFIDEVDADNPANFFGPFQSIDSQNYVDLYAGWDPSQLEGLSLSFGIDNVGDEDPPEVGNDAGPTDQNSGNTWPGTYETVGRTFWGSVKYSF